MKVNWSALHAVLLSAVFAATLFGQGQQADIVLYNGKVLTVDSNFSTSEAVAVAGKKILAVGKNDDIRKLAGPNAQVIDLKGKTVVPGLIDTHRHMYNAAENTYGGEFGPQDFHRYPVDWRGVTSKQDVLNQIKNMMDQYKFKPGQWIYFVNQLMFISGGTEEQAKILYDDLSRFDIDKVTPNNPVILSMGIPDFMGVMVNSKALDILMGKYGDLIKKYGRFWITPGGVMDGHMEPPASRLALPYTYDRSAEVLAKMYTGDMHELTSMGMTTVTTRLPKDSVAAYQLLESRGELTVRVAWGDIETFGALKDFKK